MIDPQEVELDRERLRDAERRQRFLADMTATVLDYTGADEDEPLRRIADKEGTTFTFSLPLQIGDDAQRLARPAH